MKEDTLESIKYGSDIVIFVCIVGIVDSIACIMDGTKYMMRFIAIWGVILVIAIIIHIKTTRILKKKQKDLYMSIYSVFKELSTLGLYDNMDEINSMSKKQRKTKLWKAFSRGLWLPFVPKVLIYISILFFSTLGIIYAIVGHYGGKFWENIVFFVILDICMVIYVHFASLRAKKRPAGLFDDLRRENMTFDEASEIFDSAKKIHMAIWNTDRYLFYIEYGTGHMISKEDIESIYIDNTSNGYILNIETKHGSFRRFSFEPFSLNRVKKIISE